MYIAPPKRKKFQPFLTSHKNRMLFKIINVFLVIGVISLLASAIYLLYHLNQADTVLILCIPGFVLGVASIVFYAIGYNSMVAEQRSQPHRHHAKKITIK